MWRLRRGEISIEGIIPYPIIVRGKSGERSCRASERARKGSLYNTDDDDGAAGKRC